MGNIENLYTLLAIVLQPHDWIKSCSTREASLLSKIFSVKKMHMALRLVQFLTSFNSFYFEILFYLACGEKDKLASKNSVQLGQKSNSDF